jgi:hypothetical protein
MLNKWRNYALKDGKVKKSYIREYSNRSKKWKAAEAGSSNSVQQSRLQQEEEVKLIYREPTDPPSHYRLNVNNLILNDAWVINLRKAEDGSDGSGTTREERSGRDEESSESVLAMQDVPQRKTRRKRKAKSD